MNSETELLRDALLGVALGLRMKSPPPPRDVGATRPGESIRIELAQTEARIEQGFKTRFAVYGKILRYLPDDVMADPRGLDIDNFDGGSIHFVAVREKTGEVVGTMRLVLNCPAKGAGSMGESGFATPFYWIVHNDWTVSIARRAGRLFYKRATWAPPPYAPFPILLATDFPKKKQVINDTISGCELSRLVVLPQYRGYGISKWLVRAAIAKAAQLRRKTILLECIPRHVKMYTEYGFRQIDEAAPQPPRRPRPVCDRDAPDLSQPEVARRAGDLRPRGRGAIRPGRAVPLRPVRAVRPPRRRGILRAGEVSGRAPAGRVAGL